MKTQLLYISSLILLFANCSEKKTPEAPSMDKPSFSEESTSKVLEHHWEAFKANDLEGTMADYTEESVLITPDKTFRAFKKYVRILFSPSACFPKTQAH
jgi:hypothetical protein